MRRVLIEGYNLTLAAGTGIATYARMLATTVRALGYRADVLIGSRGGLDPSDPLLNEVALYDAERPQSLGEFLDRQVRIVLGAPFGARAMELSRMGAVIGPSYEQLAAFTSVYAATHLFQNAEFHFRRYGKRLPLKVSTPPPSLFHATHPTPITVADCPNVYTIHDLVPLRLPYATLEDKKYFLNMVREICRKADHVVTVSEASRQDIVRLIGMPEDRITNLYQAVHIPDALLATSKEDLALELERLFGLEYGEYFLFVGAIEPKKNLTRLLDAYAASGSKYPLILAGGLGWQYEGDLKRIEDDRFLSFATKGGVTLPQRRVRRVSYLAFPHLISLLRGARALLFPSVYEGFGLPVLEAMLAGTPVLTSSLSSLPEVAGDAAVLVDPFDVAAIATGIKELDNDAGLRADLSARGRVRARFFAPERYQERLGALYGRIMG